MKKVSQKVLVCLLSVGIACGLGGGIVLATEPEDSSVAAEEEMCDNCTGEDDCTCCCCTDECEGTDTEEMMGQTLALTPEETTKSYHGYSFGELEISGAKEEVLLDIGESVTLTITPYAHVQYVGCSKGALCGPGLCNGGDESVFHCWEKNKGCVCDFRYDTLRLATVTVETDPEGILSCEEICDYSSLQTAGDMTEGNVVLTALKEGTASVTVKVSLYDWEDAETTFTVIVTGEDNPDTENPGDEEPGPVDPGDEEPGDGDPGNVDPGPVDPGDEEPGVVEPGPAEPDDGGSGTDNPDAGNGKTGLLKGSDGKWGYYVNGKVDTTYTGFAKNDNGKWYVVNGYVYFDQNSVYKDTTGMIGAKGTWYYVIGSKVQENFTGLANYKNANGWWYIKKGVVDFTHNGVDKNKNGWYYVTGGKVRFDFTGLANYKNTNGWWYINGGKVDFTHNGVDKNKNGWYYVTGGKVQFGFTGLAHYKNANGWWYIKGGKVDFAFKGIASNQNGTWYVSGGKVQFAFSGNVTSGGKIYTVKNGKIN